MTISIKNFIIVIISVLFIWQCGTERPDHITAEMKSDFQLLPSSGVGLAFINLENMRGSDFYQKLIEQDLQEKLNNSVYKKFTEKTGFDIRNDLHKIYMVMLSGKDFSEESGLFLAKGSFDKDKLNSFIEEFEFDNDIETKIYQQWTIYCIDNAKICFVVADENTFIVGKKEVLIKTLDKNEDGGSTANSVYWEKLIEKVQYKNDMFLSISTTDILNSFDKTEEFFKRNSQLGSVKSIKQLNLSARLHDKLFLSGAGQFEDREKATLFFDAVKGALATLKLSISDDRNVIDILNRVKLNQDNSSIRLNFNMSPEDIKKLKESESYFEKAKDIVMR